MMNVSACFAVVAVVTGLCLAYVQILVPDPLVRLYLGSFAQVLGWAGLTFFLCWFCLIVIPGKR